MSVNNSYQLSRFSVIVAIDENNGIGKGGKIPWRNREDMEHFKSVTIGSGNNTIIMGRKTYESLPKSMRPLPHRRNIVISSTVIDGVETVASLAKALQMSQSSPTTFVVGGQRLYEEAVRKYWYLCDSIMVSHIKGSYDCDVFFPYTDAKDITTHSVTETKDTFTLETMRVDSSTNKHPECQYLDILTQILKNGEFRDDRTGVGTKSLFGLHMEFDLRKGFPLLTTKRTWFDGIKKELLFFISGKTDTKILEAQGVNIWKGNTSAEYLAKYKFPWREGDMGPCFIAGAPVLTMNGYKNIEDIDIGENVYTHTGNWCPVEQIHKNSFTGNLIILDVRYHPNVITSTEEHPFYARSFIVRDRYQNKRNVVFMNDPEWIPAKSLTYHHMIGFKIETIERIPQIIVRKYRNQNVPDDAIVKSIFTFEEWYMLGYFLGDGWLVNEGGSNRIYFAINSGQINEIIPIISKVLDIQPCEDQGTCLKYRCRDIVWAQILKQFGKYAHGKRIPEWIQTAPKECITWFLQGYRRADGCYRNNDMNIHQYTTVSRDIAFAIQRLYLKLGYIASIYFQERGYKSILPSRNPLNTDETRLCNQRDVYYINVYARPKRRNNYCCIEGEYVWFTLNDITTRSVSDTLVYNLTVSQDNTYTVSNLAVHNCYGWQWRHAGADYVGCDADYTNQGIDQLQDLINGIRKDPFGRRHIVSAWDVANIHWMALPPCHCFFQVYVSCSDGVNDDDSEKKPKYLDCLLYQRSADMFLGVPFNIASYALLMCIIGHVTGLIPRKFIHNLGDAHIYLNHIDQVKEQLMRTPLPLPTISFRRPVNNIDDVTSEDIILNNYVAWPAIKGEMAV